MDRIKDVIDAVNEEIIDLISRFIDADIEKARENGEHYQINEEWLSDDIKDTIMEAIGPIEGAIFDYVISVLKTRYKKYWGKEY